MARAVHEKTISLDLNDLPQDKLQELDAYIDSLEDKKGSLIHVLHRAQNLFGYLPMEVQLYIARKLDVPGAKVFGVVSFYSYFTTEPRGKHTISVCMGTACFVKGSEDVLKKFMNELGIEKNGGMSEDKMFTVRDVRCIGACGLAPVVMVGEKVYGHVKKDDVKTIIDEYRKESDDAN
ncbi:NAD(P)H-dependent oxidoreductase subunit E [Fusibacter sp. JL216-2]|uniref:NADH-quinone oxidoreductase subunit NuoE family protein n=1 Tax=Fusibacter sp. JL216-2 TaxID=3071453 RepID=UPI003D34321A